MNISSKFQRTSLVGIAAITLAGSGLVASSASAKTDTDGGPGAGTRAGTDSRVLPHSPDAVEGWYTTHRRPAVARGFSPVAFLSPFDEAGYVTARKVALAQDRIDRPWLFR